ncbi:hypothetical protein KCP76_20195 [Salmonella enterica subsp. enterica serovar Weltevreden]|nr:hypothetical protein KCP76_20195 [Salmonella enterica subsp. enterica serovar Weltevreden]
MVSRLIGGSARHRFFLSRCSSERRARRRAQYTRTLIRAAVYLLKSPVWTATLLNARESPAADIQKFQLNLLVAFGFAHQALQQGQKRTYARASLWKCTSSDCLIHSFCSTSHSPAPPRQ